MDAHDQGLRARRRDLPPPRRRLPRSEGLSSGFDARRAGVVRRLQGRPGRAGERPGSGVADDKVVYACVPAIVKYYLGEEILIPNVPTYLCADEAQRHYVLANLPALVVKAANESGGYGMLVGPRSTSDERAEFARRIQAAPRNYIAQPTLALSRVPTIIDGTFHGRHVDLGRTFSTVRISSSCPAA